MSNQPAVKSWNCLPHPAAGLLAGRLCFGFACLASVAFAPALSVAQSAAPPHVVTLPASAQQFFAAVRANFAAWDLNHDGRLSRDEIEINMLNPRITGEAAAALAALKVAATDSDKLSKSRSYTLADIDALEQRLKSRQKLDKDFLGYFVAALKKQRSTPRQLFSEGIPRLTGMRQNWTADCSFLAAAGALAHVNPQAIVRLIAPRKDGKFIVTFPGKPPVLLPEPTDTELGAYTEARDGIWLNLLQKAYGIIRIKAEPGEASTKEPLDSVGFRRDNPHKVLELLTGHKTKEIALPSKNQGPASERLRQELRGELRSAFRDRRGIVLTNSHHAYAIVAYDTVSDLVTIHNPYNGRGTETYPDGVKVAVNDEGFFTLSATQLVKYFHAVYFEIGAHVS